MINKSAETENNAQIIAILNEKLVPAGTYLSQTYTTILMHSTTIQAKSKILSEIDKHCSGNVIKISSMINVFRASEPNRSQSTRNSIVFDTIFHISLIETRGISTSVFME